VFGYIYKIENLINHKVYIGKTYRNIYERYNEHLNQAFKNNSDEPLYKDMRKYGMRNFQLSLITKCEELDLEYEEVNQIKIHNSLIDGYNTTIGGEGGLRTREINSEIVRLYIEEKYDVPLIANLLGISKNEVEHALYKSNISSFLKKLKPIALFNKDGDFVRKYSNIYELIDLTGYSRKQIEDALKNDKEYKGYRFTYNSPF